MSLTVPERMAALEAKVDTIYLDLNVVKGDVRQLLIRDVERAAIGRVTGAIARIVPWAALVAAAVAVLKT